MVRRGLVLLAALAAVVAGSAPGQARHVRIIAETVVCTPVPRVTPDIFPAPNWEPFFRHHYYRYGPTPKCIPEAMASVIVTEPVVSVRY